jgi:hypothetical protein
MAKEKESKLPAKKIKERFALLQGKRTLWESHWQEIADYIIPNRNDITNRQTPGQKRNLQILDNTSIQSNELLAGALHGLLTSPNQMWFDLTTGIPELDDVDEVRKWLQKTTLLMHIRELYVAENNKGRIDEVYRKFCWNIRQIVGEFDEEVLVKSPALQRAWEKKTDEEFEIIHAVYPRDVSSKNTRDPRRFISQYILCDADGATEISSGFYREFPWVVARWTKAAGEVYGRGPGMTALPDAKTLNKMTETILIGAQKAVDPPLQAPDDGFVLPLVTRPGGLNYYRAGSQDRIVPIFADTRVDFGFEALRERRQRIRESFYIDQLQLNQGPQMTATEVNQRTEERMRLLGPMLGRQQAEFLRPLIDRVFEIMARKNMIPAAPQALLAMNKDLDVMYSSTIARAQKMNDGQNIARTMQSVAPFVTADPAVLDNFDGDAAARKLSAIYGCPQEIIRDKKDVEEIRASRAKAQQEALKAQQEAQGVEQVSKVAPALAKLEQTQQAE